ncbi:MAG: hypothetical protein M0R33_23665 [Methylomonas sp.]|jgi:hypothetical protein|uniref:hypothetical protein n=1 Tax=Methylomonas sp. TaxID=418 RepID=UPI0025DED5FE|nr:hypothetical protein [Methylomonas sp.]MCK9609437.1 hypothetical protein [Methylomonas sp.]
MKPENQQKKHDAEAKRDAKTAAIKRRINQEWAALNKFYADEMRSLPPNTPTLNKLRDLAIIDFYSRHEHDKTRLKVVWKIHGGHKITIPYLKTTLDRFLLIPPARYKHVRRARSLPRFKISLVKFC